MKRSLFIILDCLNWILEEIEERVDLEPWPDEISIHPFSPSRVSRWEETNGMEIIFCVERFVRNHIDEEEWRRRGVLINIGVIFGFEKIQAVIRPSKVTIGVRVFRGVGINMGWQGEISVQFKALPPRIAAKVIINIGVIIGKSLSVRLEQGIACFGDHKIIIIIRREYPAVRPVAKKAII